MAHDATTQHATPNHEQPIDLESLETGEVLVLESGLFARVETIDFDRRRVTMLGWSQAERQWVPISSVSQAECDRRPTPSELKSLHDAGAFAAAKEARS